MIKIIEKYSPEISIEDLPIEEQELLQFALTTSDMLSILINAGIIPDEPYIYCKVESKLNQAIKKLIKEKRLQHR